MAQQLSKDDSTDIAEVFSYLHIGDMQFHHTRSDTITKALIQAACFDLQEPDVCFITGDISNQSSTEGYKSAENWVHTLLSHWTDAQLFVVPGNHDVDRSRVNTRNFDGGPSDYAAVRSGIEGEKHLENFFLWHERLKKTHGTRVLSDWSTPYGCTAARTTAGKTIGIVGLNTALVSRGGDQQNLIQDQTFLSSINFPEDVDFAIAVGHHPLDWLMPWNHHEVESALLNSCRATIYLHGHRHWRTPDHPTRSQNGIWMFAAGASYDDARWPKFFSRHSINLAGKSLRSEILSYSSGSKIWKRQQPEIYQLDQEVGGPGGSVDPNVTLRKDDTTFNSTTLKAAVDDFHAVVRSEVERSLAAANLADRLRGKNLELLSTLFKSIEDFIDLVIEEAPIDPASSSEQAGDIDHQSGKSIVSLLTPQQRLESFKGLPDELQQQLVAAYDLWITADSRRSFGGDKALYMTAAEAFRGIVENTDFDSLPEKQGPRLLELASMERAYMLLCTRSHEELTAAEEIYVGLCKSHPNEPSRYLRLGQVYIELKKYSDAAKALTKAATLTKAAYARAKDDVDIDNDETPAVRIHEFAQVAVALSRYREFQASTTIKTKKIALKGAIDASHKICTNGRSVKTRNQAVNDCVYYCWEERLLITGSKSLPTLPDDEFFELAQRLQTRLESGEHPGNFREADTLLRVFGMLNKPDLELKWAGKVCEHLESAAKQRSQKQFDNVERFGDQWLADVMAYMEHADEKECLIYAQRCLFLGAKQTRQ